VVAGRKITLRRKTIFGAMKTHLHPSLLPAALTASNPRPAVGHAAFDICEALA
jgi:hypothetical protein